MPTPDAGQHRTLGRDLRGDHAALQRSRGKYDPRHGGVTPTSGTRELLQDLVVHVGFQQMALFRVASALHRRRLTPLAMVVSRLIRHVYGAEMHWAAQIEPGVLLVHGNGIVISREAWVGPGCVLSQHVTLGLSNGKDGAAPGAPRLIADVHVGPGAVLFGPIVVGPDVKIGANAVISDDVEPGTSAIAPPATVVLRRAADGRS